MGEEDEDADTLGVRRGVRIRRDARGGSASSDMTPNYSLQISFSPFRLQTVSAGLKGWAGHKCGRKSPKEGRLR